MPNQPSPDKRVVSFRVPRTLYRRMELEAASVRQDVAGWVVGVWTEATKNVELSPDDYRKIAEETEAAKRGEDRRRERRGHAGAVRSAGGAR